MERELPLRITLLNPPAGVVFQMQKGKAELVPPSDTSRDSMSFDFTVRVGEKPDGTPNFLGPFAQGPRDARFVYVNSGTYAGQTDTPWARRAKIPLGGITWKLIDRTLKKSGNVLEVVIQGRGRDGGPVCASVRIKSEEWKLRRGRST